MTAKTKTMICSKPGCYEESDVPHNKYWCKEHTPKEVVSISDKEKWYNYGYEDGFREAMRTCVLEPK